MTNQNLLLIALQTNNMNLLNTVLQKNNIEILFLLDSVEIFIELVKCNNNEMLKKIAKIPNYKYTYLILQFITINEKV